MGFWEWLIVLSVLLIAALQLSAWLNGERGFIKPPGAR
jgi:hypothetical protein